MRPNAALVVVWILASLLVITLLPLAEGLVQESLDRVTHSPTIVVRRDDRGNRCFSPTDDYCVPRHKLRW